MWRKFELSVIALLFLVLASVYSIGQSLAQRPANVGDKPAPVPILDVEDVALDSVSTLSKNQAQRSISSFLGNRGVSARYEVREYDLTWNVSVEDGSLAPVAAEVFVPVGSEDQVFPVLVIGTGSTGLADRCAPSREDLRIGNMGNYRNNMIAQASQGYIVVMPNYEGFDNPDRMPHYFNRDSEARTLLSAARALYLAANQTQLPIQPNTLFFGGYSQGGHAAFSTADYAATYTPDLEVTGIFGHGPTTDTRQLLLNNPNLAAYFMASYSHYYPAVRPEELLEPAWIDLLDIARNICVNEGFGNNSTSVSAVFSDPFETALVNNTLALTYPAINDVLMENNAGTDYKGISTLVVQGLSDTIVTIEDQNTFVEQACDRGVPITYYRYAGLNHFQTRQVSFLDTNAWIDALSRGEMPQNNCSEFE